MNVSFIQRGTVLGALSLTFTVGAASAAEYSWSAILIPSIGPIGNAFGIKDKGQVAVNSADGSKAGIYRNGIFTPLRAPPAGYSKSAYLASTTPAPSLAAPILRHILLTSRDPFLSAQSTLFLTTLLEQHGGPRHCKFRADHGI
jgi:hypothetical protein